jgi:hypothetical protein
MWSPIGSHVVSEPPDNRSPTARLLFLTHDLYAFAVLIFAVVQLAWLPNVDRHVLMFFIPPSIALLILAVNRRNAFLRAACRLFVSMIAVAVTVAELTLALPFPKAMFPGMPHIADRILCYYFVAYGLFLWIICPGYILTSWLRDWQRMRPKPVGRTLFLFTAWACWLGTMLALAAALVFGRNRPF